MSSPSLGAISAGIRWQVRFFWRHAIAMLVPKSPVARVAIEYRNTDAVDDVFVEYAAPGVNDRGAQVRADFFQLKYHVAQTGAVDHDAVIDPGWTGTKEPLLKRFADAWKTLHVEHPNARLQLVTNWPWDHSSAVEVRDGGRIGETFFTKGPASKVGKIRARWEHACALSGSEFESFIRSLRFGTSGLSQDEAEVWLRDRCQLAGLVPVPPDQDHSPYDDLGKRLIESGRTEFTPESLRDLVEKQGLIATKEPPYRSTLAVRSFSKHAHVPETDGACVVDLTDLFEYRLPRDANAWQTVRARLERRLDEVTKLPQPIHIALDSHLSIAWFAGTLFNPKCGVQVTLRQRTIGKGIELWDISAPTKPNDGGWKLVSVERGDGRELAVVLSATHDAIADATSFVHAALPAVGRIVHASLPTPGSQAIHNGSEARWLADELVRELTSLVASFRPTQLHVFPSCPASLAFLIGQGSEVLGPMTFYEFEFGAATRSYRAGMSTITPSETIE